MTLTQYVIVDLVLIAVVFSLTHWFSRLQMKAWLKEIEQYFNNKSKQKQNERKEE